MRPPSSLLGAALVVLAVACGGRVPSQRSEFPEDAGSGDFYEPGSCFCEADTSTVPPPVLDAGAPLDDASSSEDAALGDL